MTVGELVSAIVREKNEGHLGPHNTRRRTAAQLLAVKLGLEMRAVKLWGSAQPLFGARVPVPFELA